MAAFRGVPAGQARPEPRARPVHPAQRGGQHLGRAGRRDHREQPGREGPVLRAVRGQGVPAPHVLRDPRRCPAHVSRGHFMSDEDTYGAYQALAEGSDDQRWAFGTGFTDPLEGIDTTVPPGVDGSALAQYCLMLGDDALIYSHRLQQWVTPAPELEEETSLANIALDLLGQARMLLVRAGRADGTGRDEDQLAFFRGDGEFRNVRLVERLDADFAELTGRLLVFSAWRLALFDALRA